MTETSADCWKSPDNRPFFAIDEESVANGTYISGRDSLIEVMLQAASPYSADPDFHENI